VACVISRFPRVASCVFLCAVVLYAPGFVPAFMLPKSTWHDRPDDGLARRRPSPDVICPHRVARLDVVPARYGGPRSDKSLSKALLCVLTSDRRA
jgi:hypothetical protein